MNWIALDSTAAVLEISKLSNSIPQVIFKHSSRCSISAVAKQRIERSDVIVKQYPLVNFYLLDVILHREVSQFIGEFFKVHHESPQILLIKNEICVYDESHLEINPSEVFEAIQHYLSDNK